MNHTTDNAISGEVYRTLLQVALLGTELGETSLTLKIADALSELRPDLPQASIVLAMAEYCASRKEAGIQMLEATLIKFPDSQLCKAMLAVCMQGCERPGWRVLLESVIDDGRDEHATSLACAILGRDNISSQPSDSALQITPPHAMWA